MEIARAAQPRLPSVQTAQVPQGPQLPKSAGSPSPGFSLPLRHPTATSHPDRNNRPTEGKQYRRFDRDEQ